MIIAVDTGGTKTLIASFDEAGNKTILGRIPTPPNTEDYIREVVAIIKNAIVATDIDAMTIAVPGMVEAGVAIWCVNIGPNGWSNFPIVDKLKPHFPGVPIFLENDANLGGVSEVRGRKNPPEACLYATVSTGIGGGFIVNGKIDPGMRHSEMGWAMLEYDGVIQRWEDFASGRAIAKSYGRLADKITEQRDWQHISDRISRGFLAIIPVFQPELIIIGGSIGIFFERYGDILNRLLDEQLPKHIPRPKIEQANHPDEAVIYGCYYHTLDQLNS